MPALDGLCHAAKARVSPRGSLRRAAAAAAAARPSFAGAWRSCSEGRGKKRSRAPARRCGALVSLQMAEEENLIECGCSHDSILCILQSPSCKNASKCPGTGLSADGLSTSRRRTGNGLSNIIQVPSSHCDLTGKRVLCSREKMVAVSCRIHAVECECECEDFAAMRMREPACSLRGNTASEEWHH